MTSTTKRHICIQYYDSPCGKIVLASFGGKLCLCDWNDMPCAERNKHRIEKHLKADFKIEVSHVLEQAKLQLDEYFAGNRQIFELPLLPVGTDFQLQVWKTLTHIPFGKMMSYKDVAESIGKPQAARAVAKAIGANGISIIIPCHRVVGSNHSLTGFAGGLNAKRMLLRIEGNEIG